MPRRDLRTLDAVETSVGTLGGLPVIPTCERQDRQLGRRKPEKRVDDEQPVEVIGLDRRRSLRRRGRWVSGAGRVHAAATDEVGLAATGRERGREDAHPEPLQPFEPVQLDDDPVERADPPAELASLELLLGLGQSGQAVAEPLERPTVEEAAVFLDWCSP